ncbi:hypothetical protein EX30DRAFT_350038 [Ascodesmis nigricans]|uniref:Uncharacterized protein n=1 Tax=Ascodesmis nigricans TaxID=341454 RepID=A0A4S2MTK4_9PEZI|nr:hypothetical protein EX30DRAFT_350038 [Ascodesmis nigricans]
MPVPSPVPAEISKQMEEQPKPIPNSAKKPQRAPSRAKTRTCNCFTGDCLANPYCSCSLRNEPCDSRCHGTNPVGVKRMKHQCKRLDHKSAAWKTWVNGGKYIVEASEEPGRQDLEESITTTSEKRSKEKDEPKRPTPTKARRENAEKTFPTGRSKKFACNCWFGDCSNNKMCWCRRNGEPCDHAYCHSDHPNNAVNMEKTCARLDFEGEEMEDWINGGVYPPTSAAVPVALARKKWAKPHKEKNYG